MGDITQALRTAQSGLLVNQQALNVISQNVANVNTEGYSRQVVQTQQLTLAGVGSGVEISAISRIVDEGLLKTLRRETSELEALNIQTDFYRNTQELFGLPGENTSLSHLMEDFVSAVELLAVTPNGINEQSELIRRAEQIASTLQNMSDTIQALRLQADNEIASRVTELTSVANQIDQINDDIVARGSVGDNTSDLRDQRDTLLDRMSELIDTEFFFRDDGDVVVFTQGGRTIVDTVPPGITHTAASSLTPTATFASGEIAGIFVGTEISANDITEEIRGGELFGLIQQRDTTLPDLQSQIDELAAKLRDVTNQVHNRGVAFPGRQEYSGQRTFVDPATQTISLASGDTTFVMFNSTGDQQATTTLETIMQSATFGSGAQAAGGPWTVNEVAATIEDWVQANGAAGATVSASTGKLVINLNTTTVNLAMRDESATANGSSLSDVSINFDRDANGTSDLTVSGFSNFFGLNDFFVDNLAENIFETDVLSTTFTTGAATLVFEDSTGALTGSPLAVSSGTTLSELATQITNNVTNITADVIPDGSGSRLRILHDNGSSFVVTQTAGSLLTDTNLHESDIRVASTLEVRDDIVTTPGLVTTGTVLFDTTVGISGEYIMSVGDDTAIQALATALNSSQSFSTAGGLPNLNTKFTDFTAAIVARNANLANTNDDDINRQKALVDSLEFKSDSIRGVNLDEELANLIVFEQAYAAAARVLSVIQGLIDDLERAVL